MALMDGESAGFIPIIAIGVFPSYVKTATFPDEKNPALKVKRKREVVRSVSGGNTVDYYCESILNLLD